MVDNQGADYHYRKWPVVPIRSRDLLIEPRESHVWRQQAERSVGGLSSTPHVSAAASSVESGAEQTGGPGQRDEGQHRG